MPEEIPAGSRVEFSLQLPVDAETCRKQVLENVSRGVPDAAGRRKLTIIANGPSARGLDLRSIDGLTLALNGSINLFVEQGLAPTYWGACDPQPLVAGFLPDTPPLETIYLVASKCHSGVLDKLAGRDVRLWHVGDTKTPGRWHISQSCSVTITICWLMFRLGFTDLEFWGWDGCFLDGKHHASNNDDWSCVPVISMNYGGKIQGDEVIGGRVFSTTRSWAAEARAAEQFFQLAEYFDISLKINGGGMMECARQSIMDNPPA